MWISMEQLCTATIRRANSLFNGFMVLFLAGRQAPPWAAPRWLPRSYSEPLAPQTGAITYRSTGMAIK